MSKHARLLRLAARLERVANPQAPLAQLIKFYYQLIKLVPTQRFVGRLDPSHKKELDGLLEGHRKILDHNVQKLLDQADSGQKVAAVDVGRSLMQAEGALTEAIRGLGDDPDSKTLRLILKAVFEVRRKHFQ